MLFIVVEHGEEQTTQFRLIPQLYTMLLVHGEVAEESDYIKMMRLSLVLLELELLTEVDQVLLLAIIYI